MTKSDLLDDIVYSLQATDLTNRQIDMVKTIFIVKMKDYELKEVKQLPIVDTTNNDIILKRFVADRMSKGLHKSTLKQYVKCVQRLFDFTGKDFRQITGQDVCDWIATLFFEKGISKTHRSNLTTYCRTFFTWAYKKHYIKEDITRDIETIKGERKRKDRLTDEEIELMRYNCKDDRERALLELMLSTGLRVGEIENLKICDLDFRNKTALVYAPKTDSYKDCSLTNKAVLALKVYIGNRDANDYVFKAKYKNVRLSSRSIENIAKDLGKRSNAHLVTTVHVYRKTFGSILNEKTDNIVLVQHKLGHRDISTTVNCYVSLNKESMNHKFNIAMN